MKVTDHGEAFIVYLTKVIREDYQPISMQEQMFEEHLQRIKEKYYPEVIINFSTDGTGITLYKSPTPVLKDDPRYALITTDI